MPARSSSPATATCASGTRTPTWRRSPERRGAADARRARLSRARAGRARRRWSRTCGRRPGRRPVRSERRVHRRPAYCNALAAAVSDRGGRVLQGTELIGCDPLPAIGTGSGRTAATSSATSSVNAAGGWAGRVGDLLGAPVTILPQRHQALIAHLPEPLGYVMPSVMDYVPSSGGFGVVLPRRRAGSAALPGCTPRRSSTTSWIPTPSSATPPASTSSSWPNASPTGCRASRTCASATCGPASTPMRPDGRPVVRPGRRTRRPW